MRVLVTGAAGFFGYNVCLRHGRTFEIVTAWHSRPPELPGRESYRVELADAASVDELWRSARPDAVLHLAARTSLEGCESEPQVEEVNGQATRILAERAAADGVRLVYASTDLVFDGSRPPYREEDPPAPLARYGRTKLGGERAVLESRGPHLVCRVALAYGPTPGGGFRQIDWILAAAREGRPVRLFTDEYRTPIDSFTLADSLAELVARRDVLGVLHLGGTERVSRFEFGRALLERSGLDPGMAEPATRSDSERRLRPADVSLDTGRARDVLRTRLRGISMGLKRLPL